MGPSNSNFLSFGVVLHFHDYGRKGNCMYLLNMLNPPTNPLLLGLILMVISFDTVFVYRRHDSLFSCLRRRVAFILETLFASQSNVGVSP